MSSLIQTNELCQICSDDSSGKYFGFHLCSPCKAFFRRNADKGQMFKCAFINNCDINKITRRHCRKCRLDKCFKIGMRKLWSSMENSEVVKSENLEEDDANEILPEKPLVTPSHASYAASSNETFDFKLPSLPVRKNNRINCYGPNITLVLYNLLDTGSLQDLLESENDEPVDASSNHEFTSQNSFLEQYSADNNGKRTCTEDSCDFHKVRQEYFTSTGFIQGCDKQVVLGALSQPSCENESWQWKIHHLIIGANYTPIDIRSELVSNCMALSFIESAKIDELQQFALSICSIYKCELPLTLDIAGFLKVCEYCLNRLVPALNTVSSYSSLPIEDRMYLIKRNFVCILAMKTIPHVDLDMETFQVPKTPVSWPLRSLRLLQDSAYEALINFIHFLPPDLRRCNKANMLMLAIILFNAETENVTCIDNIRFHQCYYIYLFKRFVESFSPDACEARSDFYDLMMKLGEFQENFNGRELIQELADNHSESVGPLMSEILDLY
ncbi:nuclear hormone receptor HR96 [Tetranychus urticae]|uniref:Nuclear receptor domain-containing protein n=1 Tax=Tetranychus urticae TaxID=32264 RepID=T1KT39_TETUR|nr:nuclear hormone receptor HR96 [Tetranychus urticae]XP_015790256.1 nuclear hormone receptor HR96 [Tetranychus urticae]